MPPSYAGAKPLLLVDVDGVLNPYGFDKVPRDLLLVPFPMVSPNEPIDDALEMMVERSITTIPVVDELTGELLGELTATDVYSLLLGSE